MPQGRLFAPGDKGFSAEETSILQTDRESKRTMDKALEDVTARNLKYAESRGPKRRRARGKKR